MMPMKEKIYKFNDPVKSGRALLLVLKIKLASSLASLIQNLCEIKLLNKIKEGGFHSEEEILQAVDRHDTIAMTIGSCEVILWGIAVVLFFRWQYRMAANVQTWRIGNVSQKPCWGFWNFLIPVWSLYKPFVFVRELWNSAEYSPEDPQRWKTLSAPRCVKAWWTFYLLGSMFNRALLRFSTQMEQTVENMIAFDFGFAAGDLLEFAEYIALIVLVNGLGLRQKTYQEKTTAAPQGESGSPDGDRAANAASCS